VFAGKGAHGGKNSGTYIGKFAFDLHKKDLVQMYEISFLTKQKNTSIFNVSPGSVLINSLSLIYDATFMFDWDVFPDVSFKQGAIAN
jgi:hypothetical protein